MFHVPAMFQTEQLLWCRSGNLIVWPYLVFTFLTLFLHLNMHSALGMNAKIAAWMTAPTDASLFDCYSSSVEVHINEKWNFEFVVQQKANKHKECLLNITTFHNSRSEVTLWTLPLKFCDDRFLNHSNREKKVLCIFLLCFHFKWKPDLSPAHNKVVMDSQGQTNWNHPFLMEQFLSGGVYLCNGYCK